MANEPEDRAFYSSQRHAQGEGCDAQPRGDGEYLPFTRRPRSETPNVVLPLVIFIEQSNERGKAESAIAGLQVESNGPPRTYRSAKHHEVPCHDDQEVLDIIAERLRQARAKLAQQ